METLRVDIAVLGGGPGGYSAAIAAAQLGAKVALVEKELVGGTCLNRGCIPTKVYTSAVGLLRVKDKLESYGIKVEDFKADLGQLRNRKNRVVETLRKGLESIIKHWGIELVKGFGRLRSTGKIEVLEAGKPISMIEASKIILAPGSRCPDKAKLFPGVKDILTTDDALKMENIPESVVIVGGGPSGVEFACIYAGLGSKVIVAEMLPQLLPNEDEEIASMLKFSLEKMGIKVLTGAKLKGIASSSRKVKAFFQTAKGEETFEAEKVLLAFGRPLNTDGIGLEEIGVKIERKRIVVDEFLKTSSPNVYAVGDAVGGLFAHTAFVEGEVAAGNALGGSVKIDYKAVPRCIYAFPEVAAVGLTEEQAKAKGFSIRIGRFPYRASGRALTLGETEGLVKIVSDGKTGEILGVHVIGAEATELIAEATLAIKLECTVEELASTIHAHPTLAEMIREAALDVEGKAIHKISKKK
jgi:dihydrolipoamide dehydrogenase